MVEFPNPESKFEALMSGQVDVAGHTYYETPGWTKRGGKQLTAFRADTYGLSVPGDALAINKRFMEKNEDRNLNCRMVKAFTESWEAAMKEPGAATEALLRLTPKYENGDHEIVRETWMLFSALSQLRALRKMPFGFIFIEDWRHLVDIAKDYKLTKKTYPPEEYFTNEYLNCQL
jgi:ABC-type nitrate/sulfonate/bicarbonate transport system substrate-binding protein